MNEAVTMHWKRAGRSLFHYVAFSCPSRVKCKPLIKSTLQSQCVCLKSLLKIMPFIQYCYWVFAVIYKVFSILLLRQWGEINSWWKLFIVNALFSGLGQGKEPTTPKISEVMLGEDSTSSHFSWPFSLSFPISSPAGQSSTSNLSLFHRYCFWLLPCFWKIFGDFYFALCICCALMLQGALELLALPCTATDAGRPHIF